MRVGIPIPLVTPSWSEGSPRAQAHGSAPLAPGAKHCSAVLELCPGARCWEQQDGGPQSWHQPRTRGPIQPLCTEETKNNLSCSRTERY